jgi:hypothetical protein
VGQGVKCRPLRRRYILFELTGDAKDSDIIDAIAHRSGERGMTRLILREGPYIIVRVDHLTAREAGLRTPMPLGALGAEIQSISTTGSIMKAREKIKKLPRKDNVGDEEAVPVKQNKKMLIK